MNTCGTCKHFGEPTPSYVWAGDGYVSQTRLRACKLLEHLNRGDERKLLTEPAGVIDGSGYFATLCVSEEFGCNQWAAR